MALGYGAPLKSFIGGLIGAIQEYGIGRSEGFQNMWGAVSSGSVSKASNEAIRPPKNLCRFWLECSDVVNLIVKEANEGMFHAM